MTAPRFKLPGTTALKPIRQSELAGLCGLYSSLNAVRLALHPRVLSRAQVQELYLAGVAYLARRRQLRRVIGVGMSEDVWLGVAEAITSHANSTIGSTLAVWPILPKSARSNTKMALASIRASLLRGRPVLAGFGGTLDHYTVVAGFTEQRLSLFDGSGLHWLAIDGIGIGAGCERRHCLFADSVRAIVDDW